jgi:hypothetical protein
MPLNQRLIDEIAKLNTQELQELQNRIKALLSLNPGGEHATVAYKGRSSDDSMFVLGCVCSFLDSKGIGQAPMMLRRSHLFPSFCTKVPMVMEYLDGLDKIEQSAVLSIGLDLLYRYLSQWNDQPINGARILSCIHLLPACLEAAFPGYRDAGMLRMVVTNKRKVI